MHDSLPPFATCVDVVPPSLVFNGISKSQQPLCHEASMPPMDCSSRLMDREDIGLDVIGKVKGRQESSVMCAQPGGGEDRDGTLGGAEGEDAGDRHVCA